MLKSILRIPKSDRFGPTTAVFPNIIVDEIKKDLQLERLGSDRGKNDLPGQQEQGLDSVEIQVVRVIEMHRRKGLEHFQQHQHVYTERLCRASESNVNIEIIASEVEAEFDALVKDWKAKMANTNRMVSIAGDGLRHFCKKNQIDGAPREGSGVYKFVSIAIVMLVIESLCNGLLFREASSQGLLGGFIIAVSISVLNVGFASLTGLVARNLNHIHWLRKISSLVLITVFSSMLVAINFAAAHFRDAATLVKEMETAATIALNQFVTAPLLLASLQSWLLAGLGFLIAIIAGWKAYRIDDPYPGYGRVWRQMAHARDDYAQVLGQAIEELLEAHDDAIRRLEDESTTAHSRFDDAVNALAGQKSLRECLDLFLQQCDQGANYLLTIYRDTNRAARKAGAPVHFSKPFAFKTIAIDQPDTGVIDSARTYQEKVNGIVKHTVDRIGTAYKDAIASYPDIQTLEGPFFSGNALEAVQANRVATERLDPQIVRSKMAS